MDGLGYIPNDINGIPALDFKMDHKLFFFRGTLLNLIVKHLCSRNSRGFQGEWLTKTLFGVPKISEDQIGVPQMVIFIHAGSFSFVVCSNSLDDYPNTWMEKFV